MGQFLRFYFVFRVIQERHLAKIDTFSFGTYAQVEPSVKTLFVSIDFRNVLQKYLDTNKNRRTLNVFRKDGMREGY